MLGMDDEVGSLVVGKQADIAIVSLDDRLPLLGLPGSAVLAIAARRGLRTVTEYFVDRNYTADGRLVDRRLPDAMITDVDLAAGRAVDAARAGVADSLCLHGDSPGAVTMAAAVRAALLDAGIALVPFVGVRG